jgi:hypothetical protein
VSDLRLLNFLYGENLLGKANSTFKPGTIYLDVTTGELFFDDPSKETVTKHNKIIDTETLIYVLDDESPTVTFPSTGDEDASIPGGGALGGSTSAVLGTAILGTMILGTP